MCQFQLQVILSIQTMLAPNMLDQNLLWFKHRIALLVCKLLTIISIILVMTGGILHYTDVPIMDAWANVIFYLRTYAGDHSTWLEQHNEHRILIMRCLFWLDFRLFSGSGIFLYLINYFLLFTTGAVLYKCLSERLNGNIQTTGAILLTCLLVTLLSSWMQKDNLIWTFQSVFHLSYLLPLMAFYTLYQSSQAFNYKQWYLSGAIICSLLALGSMANSLLALPYLTVLAIFLRFNRSTIICLALLSVMAASCYLYDFHAPTAHSSLLTTVLTQPIEVIQYILLYLGAPIYYIASENHLWLTQMAGGMILWLMGKSVYQTLTAPVKNPLSLMLVVFLLYIFSCALGTAGGRLIFGIKQALSIRYLTPTLQAWTALLIYYAPTLESFFNRRLNLGILLCLLGQFLFLIPQSQALQSPKAQFFDYETAILAVKMNVKDLPQIQQIFPAPDPLLILPNHPITQDLHAFTQPFLRYTKEPLGQIEATTTKQCQGAWDENTILSKDPRYTRTRGWLYFPNPQETPHAIKILNAQHRIIGYGITGGKRDDLISISPDATYSGFKGYLSTDPSTLSTEIIFKDMDSDCELKAPFLKATTLIKLKSPFPPPPLKKPIICEETESTSTVEQSKLVWKKSLSNVTHQQALQVLAQMNTNHTAGTFHNWRLPTPTELAEHTAKHCNSSDTLTWSSSSADTYGYYAWDILFRYGYDYWYTHYYNRELWLVRNEKS